MKLTILHISDLHRDPSSPITNSSLLDSLERDRFRYRNEAASVGDPNLIIVSGDLIYGVAEDAKDPDHELAQQYAQAEDFLVKLAEAFVNGDRERVIIIPGNHDISLPHTLLSLKKLNFDPLDSSAKAILKGWLQQFSVPSSILRWSWKDLCFFEVVDRNAYSERLRAFATFYDRFYSPGRRYPMAGEHQFHIFDYPALQLSVAAFSSCWNNDPLNRQGMIHPDCIADAARELRKSKYSNRLRMAVWHHNTSGPPLANDYLDPAILQVLIDSNFSIGLHGHQHKAQIIDEKFQFGSNRKITVISAGTLCAGPNALPSGHARAYNLIEIDTQLMKAKLHTRAMQNPTFEQPIWAAGHLPSSMTSFVDFDIQAPQPTAGGAIIDLGSAEALVRNKQYVEAISLLKVLVATSPLARRLLLECYTSLDRTKDLIEDFYPPSADGEIVYVADALWVEGKRKELSKLIDSEIVRMSLNPAVVEVRTKYKDRLQ
jgi:hypothetical protein